MNGNCSKTIDILWVDSYTERVKEHQESTLPDGGVLFCSMKRGEPMAKGKYADWLTPEGLLKIEGWARDGLTDEQIAKNIGISRSTLNVWKDRYSDISDALKKGKDIIDRQVENALLKRALGYEYEEVKEKFEDGEITERTVTKKEVVPDTTAQIFWLKNRKPDKWRDKPAYEDTSELDKLDAILKGLKDNATHK